MDIVSFQNYCKNSAQVLSEMQEEKFAEHLESVLAVLVEKLAEGHPLLVCGNGGSAADAAHITGELVGRFVLKRKAINCLCLNDNTATMTAWGNDVGFDSVFARQVEAYGKPEGILLVLSTSGNSQNILEASEQAKKMGMLVIALTGKTGGKLKKVADYILSVPSDFTPIIQQAHQCVYHYLCYGLEKALNENSLLDPD